MKMANLLTATQELVEIYLAGLKGDSYVVRSISKYEACSECGKEKNKYGGRSLAAKTHADALEAVKELEGDLDKIDEVYVAPSFEDESVIAIELKGHSVVDSCKKCKPVAKENNKEESTMTTIKRTEDAAVIVWEKRVKELLKLKKAVLVEMLMDAETNNDVLNVSLSETSKELKRLQAPVAEKAVKAPVKKDEKAVTRYKNQVVDFNGVKVAITRMNSGGLDTGMIKFNKYTWKYNWNQGKFNLPMITGDGYQKSMLPKLKELLLDVFESGEVYVLSEAKAERKKEAGKVVVAEVVEAEAVAKADTSEPAVFDADKMFA